MTLQLIRRYLPGWSEWEVERLMEVNRVRCRCDGEYPQASAMLVVGRVRDEEGVQRWPSFRWEL